MIFKYPCQSRNSNTFGRFIISFFLDINDCLGVTCLNNGTCMDQVNGYTCQCNVGFYGLNCEIGIVHQVSFYTVRAFFAFVNAVDLMIF